MLLNALANPKNKAFYADNEITTEFEDVQLATNIELYGNEEGILYNEIPMSDESDNEFQIEMRSCTNTGNDEQAIANDSDEAIVIDRARPRNERVVTRRQMQFPMCNMS